MHACTQVRDFIVEIVVADVTDAGPPATGDDCYSRYSSLIVEQLPEVGGGGTLRGPTPTSPLLPGPALHHGSRRRGFSASAAVRLVHHATP